MAMKGLSTLSRYKKLKLAQSAEALEYNNWVSTE